MTGTNNQDFKNEIFTLPNILVYIRILLIPVFVLLYINAEDNPVYYNVALVVLVIAFLTDFFDGKIARKFNCVTDLGKTIDPIADKLYQFSVALCLMFSYPKMISVAIILFVKEISMGIMGLVLLGKGGKIFGARWYGKLSTAFCDITMVILFVLPMLGFDVNPYFADILIICSDVLLIFASVLYTRLFAIKIKELD